VNSSNCSIPAEEHYITLQNASPGLTAASLWVNGKMVSRGSITDRQVVTLDAAQLLRTGKRNTVRITATGAKGAKAVLLIGDESLAGGSVAPVGGGRALNLEFAR
jgi:P pilus assembly chaperone PapD